VKQIILVISAVCLVATACTTLDVYEKSHFFNDHTWKSSDKQSFMFDIKDTTSLYNLYVVLRHEDAYRYKNIWLDIHMQSADTSLTFKREFTLADNTHWLGNAMEDIIEHRIGFNTTPLHLKKGTYTFTIQQVMREDPLQYILNAGIRVEKAKQ